MHRVVWFYRVRHNRNVLHHNHYAGKQYSIMVYLSPDTNSYNGGEGEEVVCAKPAYVSVCHHHNRQRIIL